MAGFHLDLPEELGPYREQIAKTLKPTVRVKAERGKPRFLKASLAGTLYAKGV